MQSQARLQWKDVQSRIVRDLIDAAAAFPQSIARLRFKAAILSRFAGKRRNHSNGKQRSSIQLSECGESETIPVRLANIESTLARLESKIDTLLASRMAGTPPSQRSECAERSVITAIERLSTQVTSFASTAAKTTHEAAHLRAELREMAEGADKFLAGLSAKLTRSQIDLFLALSVKIRNGATSRFQTYEEIGAKRSVSKQAVEKAYKSLARKFPEVGAYIELARRPPKETNFSELSPSQRKKSGVESSYDHKTG